jgi:hypothetical protein
LFVVAIFDSISGCVCFKFTARDPLLFRNTWDKRTMLAGSIPVSILRNSAAGSAYEVVNFRADGMVKSWGSGFVIAAWSPMMYPGKSKGGIGGWWEMVSQTAYPLLEAEGSPKLLQVTPRHALLVPQVSHHSIPFILSLLLQVLLHAQ